MKTTFLNNELWSMTVGASFQRANIYLPEVKAEDKRLFKAALRKEIELKLLPGYTNGKVSTAQHVGNVYALSKCSGSYNAILQNDALNFGVCQKMLNLYLKYQWCLGTIAPPPHFPVDRIIQHEFNKLAKANDIDPIAITPWTQYKDETNYLSIVDFATKLKHKAPELKAFSLPEIELYLFERRS